MFKSVITILSAFTITANALVPPTGFQLGGENYLVSQDTVNFFEAYITCKEFHFELATVLDEEENHSVNNSLSLGKGFHYWVGGVNLQYSDVFVEKWVWIDSDKAMSYTNWASGQPKILPKGTNCLALDDTGKFVSHECTHILHFICQS